MSKIYLLTKTTFGDFDCPHNEAILASTSEETIRIKAAEKNAERNPADFKHGEWSVEYSVSGPVSLV
jgi:hypothetical protein